MWWLNTSPILRPLSAVGCCVLLTLSHDNGLLEAVPRLWLADPELMFSLSVQLMKAPPFSPPLPPQT